MPIPRYLLAPKVITLALTAAVLLQGCGGYSGPPPVRPVLKSHHLYQPRAADFVVHPETGRFSICHGHTCSRIATTGLGPSDWRRATADLREKAATPELERERIARAVGIMEQVVGIKTGTASDRAGNLAGLGQAGQMDCVDEATNTSVYLTLFANAGLLHWHEVHHRTSRGFINLRGPHSTAVIRDRSSGEYYAVDSWFRDNGEPAYVIPLSTWRWGWTPPGW